MPFPPNTRVIYRKNPLRQVICQLRFPPILKIDTVVPADFQEKLRTDLPNFKEMKEAIVELSTDTEALPPELVRSLLNNQGIKNYEFYSDENLDDQWKVNLTRNFIALTASKYRRWEEFKERFRSPFDALVEVYTPNHFVRTGLRYINVIKRSDLGLNNTDWNELLEPHILGILGSKDVSARVENLENITELALDDNVSKVRVTAKLVTEIDGEQCFVIDGDFFNNSRVDVNSIWGLLDFLNTRSSRLIRWCITDRLHEAMEPTKL